MKILIIILIILLIMVYLLIPTIYRLGNYRRGNNKRGYRVLIIGGTHGNEPAGYYAIKEVYEEIKNRSDKLPFELIMIPDVNRLGLFLNMRTFFHKDVNREYGNENGSFSLINKLIEPIARNSDLILDLHEGWSYNKINENSMGSTLSGKNISTKLINQILKNLNNQIKRAEKKFYFTEYQPIIGTLDEIFEHQTYILLETTGQNNIQPLDLRIKQMKTTIYSVLRFIIQSL